MPRKPRIYMKFLVFYVELQCSRQCENVFPMFLVFCWIKYCQSVIALTNILKLTKKSCFSFFLSIFMGNHIGFQRAGRVFKLMQNDTHHKTTPNTTSERTSRLTKRTLKSIFLESDTFLKSFTQRVSVYKIRKYIKIKISWIVFSKGSGTKNMWNHFLINFFGDLLGVNLIKTYVRCYNLSNYQRKFNDFCRIVCWKTSKCPWYLFAILGQNRFFWF